MSMPGSTIRHRPIYAERQIAPVGPLRSSKQRPPHQQGTVSMRATVTMSWHVAFCSGMAMALIFLLFGHFI